MAGEARGEAGRHLREDLYRLWGYRLALDWLVSRLALFGDSRGIVARDQPEWCIMTITSSSRTL